ncbi:zinc finger ZZ-type and EF-hand domain-containing protein 1 [Neolamprologus brichardi]|uniref:zinc finger ZZ-type and EF-hand domain-containing protein 1 n=1 Tax=Neolamprologus brichardi TaxID=32507 RepID=UPI0003EC6905|nr:zinc finger ZZ-type and EF-hand domain-containing protein 1 [Neolamprologus brichardi]
MLPQLFKAVISNAGSLNETYHLTLGLLGQLLLRIPPTEADAAVTEALADKYELLIQGEMSCSDIQGWKTIQLLFSLGAVCLDSRIGLDWACTVADILHSLNACPEWCTIIAAFTDHCIQQLPQTLKRTNLFTLLVLVGFAEVLCVGTQTVFIDNANEKHNMILLKHFTEKNHAAVVDVRTRKRKTVKDYQLIQSQDSCTVGLPGQPEGQGCPKTLLSRYLGNFTSIISHLLQTSQDNGSPDAVEASWVLSLALKGLYNILKKHGVEHAHEAIQESGLTQLLVRKCSKGTGFSKLWLLRDLEILSIMLYSSKREIHSMAQDPEREQREQDKEHDSDHSSCCADDTDVNKPDPLEGLDEETILQRVLKGCSHSMLCSLSLTACQFMEEPGMAVQVRESKHPYDNNTNFEDKVHIPGAIYLSVKFDSRCYTEEGCDELIMSSSSDFVQDVHNFSGSPQKWSDFEIPGDTLYYRFMSDMSNTEWGYKFTVTGGHRGRFQTGFEILKQMLADDQVLSQLPLADIWEWQVGVACRQTGNQRLRAIHLLLRLLQCQSQT